MNCTNIHTILHETGCQVDIKELNKESSVWARSGVCYVCLLIYTRINILNIKSDDL